MPVFLNLAAPVQANECDECRAHHEAELARSFEAFIRPFLESDPFRGGRCRDRDDLQPRAQGVREAWPGHSCLRRVSLPRRNTGLGGEPRSMQATTRPSGSERLGCRVYRTPEPVPAPFASIASRVGLDARYPHLLFFLGARRVVFQTYMPFSTLDEDVDDECRVGPALSMSMQERAGTVLESLSSFVPAVAPGVMTAAAGCV